MMKNKRTKTIVAVLLAVCLAISAVVTFALFSDRVSHETKFTTATFTADGYKLTRVAPEGPFVAGEPVETTLKESNTGDDAVKSVITMSAKWTSPDTSLSIFGNASAEDNATLTIDGEALSYDVNTNGTITFVLPEHILTSGASDIARKLVLNIPESFTSTGEISFMFDKVVVGQNPYGFSTEYSHDDLNKSETLDFDVQVGWAASNLSNSLTTPNGHKALMGYLTEKDSNNKFGIEFKFEFDYTESAMKDFESRTASKWSYYKDTVSTLTFVEGMTTIGDYAFPDFSSVTSVSFPTTVTDIGISAFDASGLTGEVTIPATVTNIESLAFGNLPNVNIFTFNHTSDTLTLPDNTSEGKTDKGAFYVPDYVETTVNTNVDEIMYGYRWHVGYDNRRPVPTLAAQQTWFDPVTDYTFDYNGTTYNYSTYYVDNIILEDWYEPTDDVVYTWDASEAGDGSVTAYLIETGEYTWDIVIAGNGYSKIMANEDSSYAFTNMRYMVEFDNADIFDVSNVVDAEGMYSNCRKMTTIDVSNWNTSSMKYMGGNEYASYGMFMDCSSLTELDVSEWDVSQVENMNRAFEYCNLLETLDVSDWETNNLVYGERLFYQCEALETIAVGSWTTAKLQNANSMFACCTGVSDLDVDGWTVSNVTDMASMFEQCTLLETLDLSEWNVGKVLDMQNMFSGDVKLTSIGDTTDWNTGLVEYMENMFYGCTGMTEIKVANWDMKSVKSIQQMFMNCSTLTDVDTSKWVTSSLLNANGVFRGCSVLEYVDVDSWDMDQVTSISNLFDGASVIDNLDISGWDLSSVGSNPSYVFRNCVELTELTIPATLKELGYGFAFNCPKLTKVVFLHDADDEVSLSLIPGSNYGSFYVSTVTGLNVVTENENVKAYNWTKDNRGYTITVNSATGGTLEADTELSINGKTITLTNTPATDYLYSGATVSYTDENGTAQTLSLNASTSTFTMPAGDVTVTPKWTALVTKIEVTTQPTTTEYEAGEDFSKTGMVVTATYADGSTKNITSYSVTDGTDLAKDQSSVSISYTENGVTKTTTTPITVVYIPTLASYDELKATIPSAYLGTSVSYVTFTSTVPSSYTVSYPVAIDADGDGTLDNDIKCYVKNGTTDWIYIYSSAPRIYANPDSSYLFSSYLFGVNSGIQNLERLDTSKVVDMSYMFSRTPMESADLSTLDLSSVENMSNMFYNNENAANYNISSWDVSNVEDFSYMFNVAFDQTYQTLNLSGWKTTSATNMSHMFDGCTHITRLTISGFDTEGVTDVSYMFNGCTYLYSIDVSSWDVSDVEDFSYMFSGCTSNYFNSLDVSGWDTRSAKNMSHMFGSCDAVTELDVSGWDVSDVEDFSYMFSGCTGVSELDVSNWEPDSALNMSNMFYCASTITTIDLSNFDTRNVSSLAQMFYGCSKLTTMYLNSNFGQTNNIPTAGSSTGFAYVTSQQALTIYNANTVMKNYEWTTDKRTVTHKTASTLSLLTTDGNVEDIAIE